MRILELRSFDNLRKCWGFLGGVLFKVYIVGEAIRVVRRFSLPDVSRRELSEAAGVFRFPRVSCAAASADEADLDPNIAGKIFFIATDIVYNFPRCNKQCSYSRCRASTTSSVGETGKGTPSWIGMFV